VRPIAFAALSFVLACGANTAGVGGSGGSHAGSGGGTSAAGGSGGNGGAGTGGSSSGTGGGTSGTGGSSSGTGGSSGGGPTDGGDGCPDSAKTVYVVDADNTFSSFDPTTKTFHDIGSLNCPASGGANPFSMGISRDAFAYVLYSSGEVFKVDTGSLACTKTTFVASSSFTQFGMGFSTDTVGGTTDSLFIAGGAMFGPSAQLGHLDTTTFQASVIGQLSGWPELTGTGSAQLWGFFPQFSGGGSGMPKVAQLDKTTGSALKTFPQASLAGNATDWAFAFWGGDFYIFLERDTDDSTGVYQVDGTSGSITSTTSNTGRNIVGAGVSTCAPVTIN
jgi:hypothetical protein